MGGIEVKGLVSIPHAILATVVLLVAACAPSAQDRTSGGTSQAEPRAPKVLTIGLQPGERAPPEDLAGNGGVAEHDPLGRRKRVQAGADDTSDAGR